MGLVLEQASDFRKVGIGAHLVLHGIVGMAQSGIDLAQQVGIVGGVGGFYFLFLHVGSQFAVYQVENALLVLKLRGSYEALQSFPVFGLEAGGEE